MTFVLRIQTPRTPPELTWISFSISSSATRWAPWVDTSAAPLSACATPAGPGERRPTVARQSG